MEPAALKVLQVCPYDITRAGGVQRHVVDLSNALAGAGHAVTIVAPAGAVTPAPAPGTMTNEHHGWFGNLAEHFMAVSPQSQPSPASQSSSTGL